MRRCGGIVDWRQRSRWEFRQVIMRNVDDTVHYRAYCGCRRFFAHTLALRLRPQFSRAIRKVALRAYCGCRRFFAHTLALRLRPQFSRAIRKVALSCLLRLPPLLCSYSGAHSMKKDRRKTVQARFSLLSFFMAELLLYIPLLILGYS